VTVGRVGVVPSVTPLMLGRFRVTTTGGGDGVVLPPAGTAG